MKNLLLSAAVALATVSAATAQDRDVRSLRADYTSGGHAGRLISAVTALAEPALQIAVAAKKLGIGGVTKVDCHNIADDAPMAETQYCTAFEDFLTVYHAQVEGKQAIAAEVRDDPRSMCAVELALQDALAAYDRLQHRWQQEFPGEPMPGTKAGSIKTLRAIAGSNESACQ